MTTRTVVHISISCWKELKGTSRGHFLAPGVKIGGVAAGGPCFVPAWLSYGLHLVFCLLFSSPPSITALFLRNVASIAADHTLFPTTATLVVIPLNAPYSMWHAHSVPWPGSQADRGYLGRRDLEDVSPWGWCLVTGKYGRAEFRGAGQTC